MKDSSLPLFYKSPRILQPTAHGDRSLARQPDFRFAAQTNSVPLVADAGIGRNWAEAH